MRITAPTLVPAQRDAWLALIEISEVMPEGWCLVGGQMVHLYCWERDYEPTRPTTDGDTVLDVRAHPTVLHDFTALLTELGFRSPGPTRAGTRFDGCAVAPSSTS